MHTINEKDARKCSRFARKSKFARYFEATVYSRPCRLTYRLAASLHVLTRVLAARYLRAAMGVNVPRTRFRGDDLDFMGVPILL